MESMSGYGVARMENEHLDVTVEISSVNSRFLDIYIRGVKDFFGLEDQIRDLLQKKLDRGKLNVNVNVEYNNPEEMITPNYPLLDAYHRVLERMAQRYLVETTGPLTDYLRLPGALQAGYDEETSEMIKESILTVLEQSIDSLKEMRRKEGKNLEAIFGEYLQELEERRKKVEELAQGQMKTVAQSLKNKLESLLEDRNISEDRLYTEIGLLAEKTDISEEIVRLKSHLEQYKELLSASKVGKQCKFLTQELHREVNTIGSKSISIDITKEVIEMKTLIEKIREQIENVE